MADLRPQYSEEVVGHGHPTKADVTNRAWNIQHDEDGTHKNDVIIAANLATDAVKTDKIKDANVTAVKLEGAIPETGGGSLKVKVIEIGNWNMDNPGAINVAHGLTATKIRSVDVWIQIDDDQTWKLYHLNRGTTDCAGMWDVSATNIILTRTSGQIFDATEFNSTTAPANRGWITIWYAA